MAYSKQMWHDEPTEDTPLSAARLGHMEDGIGAAADVADAAATAAATEATTRASADTAVAVAAAADATNKVAAEATSRATADALRLLLAGGTMSGDIAMGGHKISGAADPTAAQDVATRAYVLAQIASLVNSAPGILDTLGEIATALQADESTAAALATTVAARMVYVVHGSTAATARPTTTGPVYWVGSVTPTNAVQNDVWQDTSSTPAVEKLRGASTFASAAGTPLASGVTVTPVGNIASTDVQAALAELDSEKADATATTTSLALKPSKAQALGYALVFGGI